MNKTSLSLAALIVANLVPLVGVLFFGWDHILVIALFWIENLIIGGFNLVRMLGAIAVNKSERKKGFSNLFHPAFFVVHYGLFCAVHGSILWEMLDLGELPKTELANSTWNEGFASIFIDGASVFQGFVALYSPIIWLGIVSLFLSRLVSFIENFILKGEVFEATVNKLMGRPYGQIVIMHAGIILGALAIDKWGNSLWLLLVIVGFKIVVDVATHKRQHKKADKNIESRNEKSGEVEKTQP